MGTPLKRSADRHRTEEHLAELARLADAAGAAVCGTLLQQFDDELSPAQGKNVEQATGVRVMDRAELILDIFASPERVQAIDLAHRRGYVQPLNEPSRPEVVPSPRRPTPRNST